MTTLPGRPFRLIAALSAVTGVLLTGCSTEPTRTGAAAIIGDRTVLALDDVQARLDAIYEREPELRDALIEQGQIDEVSRNVVTLAVRHELISELAAEEGLTVDDAEIDALIEQSGGAEAMVMGTPFTEQSLRTDVADQLLLSELGNDHLGRLRITFDFVQATDRTQAMSLAEELAADPERISEVVEESGAAGLPGGVDQTLTPAESPALAATALFGTPVGSVVAFEVQPQSGQWMVAAIRERTVAESSSDAGAAGQVDPSTSAQFGLQMLNAASQESDIQINPRYGVWDPTTAQVAPNEGESGGVVIPMAVDPAQ